MSKDFYKICIFWLLSQRIQRDTSFNLSFIFRKLESENQSCQTAMEAFRQSVKTKDELIMRMWESQENLEKLSRERALTVTEAVDIGTFLFVLWTSQWHSNR